MTVRSPDGVRAIRRAPAVQPALFVFPGTLDPYRFLVRLGFASGWRSFAFGGAFRAFAPDPTSDVGWVARSRARDAGLTCAGFQRQAPRLAPRPDEGAGFEACGDLRRHPIFFQVDTVQCHCGPGAPVPVRTAVLGAVSRSVSSVALRGAAGEIPLAMAPAGRAFLAVLPLAVTHRDLTLTVRFRGGRVQQLTGLRAANLR